MHTHRNPADLLGLNSDTCLHRLLRACGTDEAYITGGASDYDKFLALADALPLCEGHPRQAEINRILQDATGITAPLCPHTAHTFWEAWTELHWYGRQPVPGILPTACPCCMLREPTYIGEDDLAELADPMTVCATDLSTWSLNLKAAFWAVTGKLSAVPAVRLPEDYRFVRPDPYHAGEVIRKLAGGEALASHERDLLLTQALRVWGQAALQIRWGGGFLLRGGHPDAVTALLAYLNTARALPILIWIPDNPADAGAISGLYARVGTGMDLSSCASAEKRESRISAYAAVAPIGRAVVME